MVMGERGMADMAEMEMPLPDNTAADDDRRRARSARSRWAACSPWSRCDAIRSRGDYTDPGWYRAAARHAGLRVDRRAGGARAIEPKAGRRCRSQRKAAPDAEVKSA